MTVTLGTPTFTPADPEVGDTVTLSIALSNDSSETNKYLAYYINDVQLGSDILILCTTSTQTATKTFTPTSAGGHEYRCQIFDIVATSSGLIAPGATSSGALPPGEVYGAIDGNNTGDSIGGGAGYSSIYSSGDVDVSTLAGLVSALSTSTAGEVVFIAGGSTIDLTGSTELGIPAGVILASNRGLSGSLGALLKKTAPTAGDGYVQCMFKVKGDDVRVTGLRINGENFAQDYGNVSGQTMEWDYLTGIKTTCNDLEVDNCEIWGWAWAGIQTMNATGGYFHHNYIHHNQARSEGYGCDIYAGDMIVEANYFDNNRHSVVGGGWAGEQYTVRYNYHYGHGNCIGGCHFDVHETDTGGAFAGDEYWIHHNTIAYTSPAEDPQTQSSIHIRENPVTGVHINNNLFYSAGTYNGVPGGIPIYQTVPSSTTHERVHEFTMNNYWKSTASTDFYANDVGIIWDQYS